MMNGKDREEALQRFIPWDHQGPIPSETELEAKLLAARQSEAAEQAAERAAISERRPERLLERIKQLEAEVALLRGAPR